MKQVHSKVSRRQFLLLASGAAALEAARSPSWLLPQLAPRPPHNAHLLPGGSPLLPPYAPLHGGSFSGKPISASPDPLVQYQWLDPRSTDELQSYALTPASFDFSPPYSFQPTGPQPFPVLVMGEGSIRFDFGVESAAWLEFDSDDFSGSVEMSISEYDEPAIVNSGPPHRFKTAAPVRYGNTYRLELNPELYEGLRFGWLHVRQWQRPWHIRAVRAVCQVKPASYAGSFACSDSMLTRIWYTGAYVVKANLTRDYFGSILMDRGDRISWTGDAHPAQSAAIVAFGNWDFVRQNLKRTATDSNGIESYPLYWVLSLAEYYRHTADRPTFADLFPQAEKVLQHGEKIFADPPISFYGWDERLGAGFEAPDNAETKNAYRMLFIRACIEFASAARHAGHPEASSRYQSLATGKWQAIRSSQPSFGIHASADAANTDLLTSEELQAAYELRFADRLDRLSYSPFNQFFLLLAMMRMGRVEDALTSMHDMWGGQIEYGGTTFFETYTPSWNKAVGVNGAVPNCQSGYTSLGHPWGAGVVSVLSSEVLGIKPASPGFDEIAFKPRLGSSLDWVSGSVPTPHGPASLDFNRVSGRYQVTIPPGTSARVALPVGSKRNSPIRFRQRVLWDGQLHPAAGIATASEDAEYIYLEGVQPGRYTFELLPAPSARPAARPILYKMSEPAEDRSTQGNWNGRYGRNGYIFFNYDGVAKHRIKLSPGVASVKPSTRQQGRCLDAQLESETGDARALVDEGAPKHRKLGQLNTGDPAACQQTMSIDVQCSQAVPQQVALYCVDWEDLGRRQAIEVFDLETLSRLAPVHLLRDFTEGCYLVYRCDRPVRFRINQVRGRNAVLSALFFDPV